MSRFAILIVMQHRYRLLFTYILFSLEMLGNLLRPFFLGLAVNDLIKGSYNGLVLLSAVNLGWLILGTIRHRLDNIPYTEQRHSSLNDITRRIELQEEDFGMPNPVSIRVKEVT